jgi:hypothetical protein
MGLLSQHLMIDDWNDMSEVQLRFFILTYCSIP